MTLCAALLTSKLCSTEQRPTTAEGCFALYHSVLSMFADEFAPVRRVTLRRQRLALWMDDECRRLRMDLKEAGAPIQAIAPGR